MLDRQWKYPLEYAEEIYFKAKKENMDEFIYEARSLYTLLVAKFQCFSFDISEVEDHIRALEYKIQETYEQQEVCNIGFPKLSKDWYMSKLVEVEREIKDIKLGLENNINKEEQHD